MKRSSHVALGAAFIRSRADAPGWSLGPERCLVAIALAAVLTVTSFAATRGAGVVPFHFVRGFAVILPVKVNGSGPYDFMLDTGTTVTTVDRELGRELALQPQGQATATTLTERTSASIAVARSVMFGSLTEQNVEVMIRDLSGLRRVAPTARGVLGQNALNHADFLLDYRHKLLEIDTDGELAHSLKGHHIPLRREMLDGNPQYVNLSVQANRTDDGVRPMDVLLDSGAASMVLFGGIEQGMDRAVGFVADTGGRQLMSQLRTIRLVIDGNTRDLTTNVVAFHAAGKNIDGLLPTSIFSRIYISNSGEFAIFEPKMQKAGSSDRMVAVLRP